jgi:type I restriction enzyme S subunit
MMSGKMYRFRVPSQSMESRFVEYYLQTMAARDAIDKMKTGGSDSGLNLTHDRFRLLGVPLAPTPEQRRIVAKIEELFSQLDAGVEELKKAKAQLKRYRQSVLKAAFEGKLTEEWRKAHKCKVESASDLPEGWTWARIGELAERIQYGTSDKACEDSRGVPVVRMGNLRDGALSFENLKYMPRGWSCVGEFLLSPGDVLFNRTNSAELVGKTAVYKEGSPQAVFASYLIRLQLHGEAYLPALLSAYINSHFGRTYIAQVVSQQVGQANVSGSKLAAMPVPVPALTEQREMAAEMERRLSIADAEEKAIEAALKQAARLRQSILKRAFEGRLVPQDPSDEPAERLLERIRAEKAKREAGQSRGRGRRTAAARK